ncbi:MAG: PD40 domain-containing protein [Anaerolineales bacterium]
MKLSFKNILIIWSALAILLVSCSGGGEAPNTPEESEALHLPESQFLRLFERTSGRILYMGLDGNLHTIKQTGEGDVMITQDSNFDQSSPDFRGYLRFAWSPNGEKIAYVGLDPEKFFMHTINADGSNPVEKFASSDEFPIYLFWTPDSEFIGFLTNKWASSELQMHYVSAEGASSPKTLGSGEVYYWVWEPHGHTRFLVHVEKEQESQLMMVSTGDEQAIEYPLHLATFQAPAWSPKGDQLMLAVKGESEKENHLIITNLEGHVQSRLAIVSNSCAFSWSPDGKSVAYISSDRHRGGVMGPLTVQNIANKDEKLLVDDPYIFAFFWAPDNKKIAYFTREIAPGDETSDTANGYSAAVTLYTLDLKSGKRTNLFSFFPTDLFSEVLSQFDQYQYSSSIWSPDSENIVISAQASDGQGGVIIVVPASGNLQPRPIVEGFLAFWSPK